MGKMTPTSHGESSQDPGEAPESAFEFQPTKIKTMVGGLVARLWRLCGLCLFVCLFVCLFGPPELIGRSWKVNDDQYDG